MNKLYIFKTIVFFQLFYFSNSLFAGDWTRINANTIKFKGEITFDEYNNYLEIIGDNDEVIIVDSEGGFTGAGVDIGLDMLDRDLTVIVRNECLSSCANYLFLAARKKIIDNGYVGFHGSNTEYQKHDLDNDIMEMRGDGLSEFELSNYVKLIKEISEKEEKFFDRVRVDKSLFEVSRLDDKGSGDGRVYSFLALSIKAFADFKIYNVSGVVNINTDPEYAPFIYLKK